MPKLRPYVYRKDDDEPAGFSFWCPGCEGFHAFRVRSHERFTDEPVWSFDGNLEAPTFSPSLRCSIHGKTTCHLFLRNGQIEYCSDSPHALAGKTVPLSDHSVGES